MRQRPNRPLLALCAALLVGVAMGYTAEAGAREAERGGDAVSGDRSGSRGFDRRRDDSGRVLARPGDLGGGVSGSRSRDDRRDGFRDRRDEDRRGQSRGWRDVERVATRSRARGSFLHVYAANLFSDFDGGDGDVDQITLIDPSAYGPGFWPLPSYPSEPKFIDIEADRLDRRPVAPGRIEVVDTGGAKIIRIAPDYSRPAGRSAEVGVAPARFDADYLQPWSAGWLKHCMESYRSFDPALGTYVARDGRVRFCEGSR